MFNKNDPLHKVLNNLRKIIEFDSLTDTCVYSFSFVSYTTLGNEIYVSCKCLKEFETILACTVFGNNSLTPP